MLVLKHSPWHAFDGLMVAKVPSWQRDWCWCCYFGPQPLASAAVHFVECNARLVSVLLWRASSEQSLAFKVCHRTSVNVGVRSLPERPSRTALERACLEHHGRKCRMASRPGIAPTGAIAMPNHNLEHHIGGVDTVADGECSSDSVCLLRACNWS